MSLEKKCAFLFPGQGSQFIGMGEEFFSTVPEAENVFRTAEDVTGLPVTELCFHGPAEELVKTANLQPCLTAVEIACATVAVNRGLTPSGATGHSLGEYPALWCAGVLTVEDAVRLVHERGKLMEEAAVLRPGTMAAIIGVPRDKLELMVDECRNSGEVLSLANHNSPEQIVVTGEKEPVSRLCKKVKETKARAIPLKVSGGYHSELMKHAADAFSKVLEGVTFSSPRIPVYSNVTGKPETDAEKIKRLMVEQICAPVRWVDIVNSMTDDGINLFIESGPKKVLTNLTAKCIDKNTELNFCQFDTPEALGECLKCAGM